MSQLDTHPRLVFLKELREGNVVDESGRDPEPPNGVDLSHPSVARVYDYYLGGTANWAIDRRFGSAVLEKFPMLRDIAVANRQFLHRVVQHLVDLGVKQFIDVGSGVPTVGPTHIVAGYSDPDSTRVVYVDNEPVAVAHSQILLAEDGDPRRHQAILADLRDPDALWTAIEDTQVIDFSEPVALLMIAVLHVQQQDEAGTDRGAELVARYREKLPRGSYLALSHITDDGVPDYFQDRLVKLKEMYDVSSSPVIWRSHDDIRSLFGDFTFVDPDLSWTPEWHPEIAEYTSRKTNFKTVNESVILAGLARKD